MTGKVFLDTNIIIYAEFDSDIEEEKRKHRIASRLILHDILGAGVFVSTQIFHEFYVQALRKGKREAEIEGVLEQFSKKFNVVPVDIDLVKDTWRIKARYQFSYWDSLVVAASLKT
jgi:predicted nucleic acid-binding protein